MSLVIAALLCGCSSASLRSADASQPECRSSGDMACFRLNAEHARRSGELDHGRSELVDLDVQAIMQGVAQARSSLVSEGEESAPAAASPAAPPNM